MKSVISVTKGLRQKPIVQSDVPYAIGRCIDMTGVRKGVRYYVRSVKNEEAMF